MNRIKTLASLIIAVTWLPVTAQHTIRFHGDTVFSIKIAESNSYLEWKTMGDFHETVYPPEAWIEYSPTWNEQKLLKRNSQRTKTTRIDISAWSHLDSLLSEIGVSRLATAADIGITEQMLKKALHSWTAIKRYKRWERACIQDFNTIEKFDRWLVKEYEENKDTNVFSIMTDTYGFINVEITISPKKKTNVSIWRHYPDKPYHLDGRNRFNLNIYRHLCALMPKTFDFSYEDFQKKLIMAFFEYLAENWNELK